MAQLAQNRYGKSRVRLMKITRANGVHSMFEWTVQVMLRGDFADAHLTGDNAKILATDTMKNTVYARAQVSTATSMEAFAQELIDFLLSRNPQAESVEVNIASTLWKRMKFDGAEHATSFMRGSNERQTTHVRRAQGGEFSIVSGLEDMVVMKTADSGFSSFLRDELTTLPETEDRLFATSVKAEWPYLPTAIAADFDYDTTRDSIREAMLRVFAEHKSKSVQQTMFAMGEAALEATPAIDEISMTLPNIHCLPVDQTRFGQQNTNQIFVPTDEPHGQIEATIRRG